MIEALARHGWTDPTSVTVLTTYPDEDRRLADPGVVVVPLGPKRLVAVDLPLSVIGRLLPRRLGRALWSRSAALAAIADADVVADISGVSFADDRGPKFNIYNAMLTVLPLMVGTPIVKCSQAVGPFEQRSNRVLARLLLPRVERILARGKFTEGHLRTLGLTNVEPACDLAFTLTHDDALEPDVEKGLANLPGVGTVVVMPSAVVEGWCERNDIDHTAVFSSIIEAVCDQLNVSVALVPHAYRASGKPRRMDDARVCRTIAQSLGHRADVVVIDRDLTPGALRAIVHRSDMLVTSRFHGMVTGLASGTPTVVVGWGHKYAEVLAQFDAEHAALDYSALRDPERVIELIVSTWASRDTIRSAFAEALVPVRSSALTNFAVLTQVGSAE